MLLAIGKIQLDTMKIADLTADSSVNIKQCFDKFISRSFIYIATGIPVVLACLMWAKKLSSHWLTSKKLEISLFYTWCAHQFYAHIQKNIITQVLVQEFNSWNNCFWGTIGLKSSKMSQNGSPDPENTRLTLTPQKDFYPKK